jgi:hypothetical protein
MLTGSAPGAPAAKRREYSAQAAIMGDGTTDSVIELDTRGVGLLKSWASPCTEFRVTRSPDGAIVLHPMFTHDADLWRSGLVDQIVENFVHPDLMIRLKPDKL